ncbi:UNVERIFIED_CONTAM: hypothetical protein GTU68_063711 [Idotea baltica]|nr:hypothetical protein [Idotea baltica]
MEHVEKIIDEKIQGKALVTENKKQNSKKLFIESYGCQMNMNDSEIVAAILDKQGYNTTQILEEADLVLVNTCSIREKAETTVRKRLQKYNRVKRLNSNGVSAFVSITRGCDNMCTFCVVPFTRGRERSRDPKSILEEIGQMVDQNYKEITLLGQNVDSFLWYGGGLKKDFKKASEMAQATAVDFAQLLDMCATQFPKTRFRFSTSNPQDMSLDVIHTMAKHKNICKYIHLPVQSGSNAMLKAMNRQHTREEYMELVDNIYKIIPEMALSQDMIVGFCGETEQDHQDTLDLMEYVKYDFGFMFAYSERPGTLAGNKMDDDVPNEVKKRRLTEVIDLQQKHALYRTKKHLGKTEEVLIEGTSKKDPNQWKGRNTQNTVIVFPKEHYKLGDFVMVKVEDCTSATLIGKAVGYSPS